MLARCLLHWFKTWVGDLAGKDAILGMGFTRDQRTQVEIVEAELHVPKSYHDDPYPAPESVEPGSRITECIGKIQRIRCQIQCLRQPRSFPMMVTLVKEETPNGNLRSSMSDPVAPNMEKECKQESVSSITGPS
ncbi:hypothetical protein F441_20840 [Phytophthora nicotianae CJ01A1]|uniref:Uncharacterized protein n=1 Tax=Phytophthora nicotianae CJ01A1 TaxID=1317063 RepID=W2VUV3_PHYNI|nr:hypothetical protein F441_20840 [Phytophthora nicotianae CJ01A1]